jgi:hypothetical protein
METMRIGEGNRGGLLYSVHKGDRLVVTLSLSGNPISLQRNITDSASSAGGFDAACRAKLRYRRFCERVGWRKLAKRRRRLRRQVFETFLGELNVNAARAHDALFSQDTSRNPRHYRIGFQVSHFRRCPRCCRQITSRRNLLAWSCLIS